MSRIRIEVTDEMLTASPDEVLAIAAEQIERRLRAAIAASHGKRGLAMLDDALDVMEEAMEAPPLGYRRGGPEQIKIEGEVL